MSEFEFDGEQLIASAVQYLLEGEEYEAAQALLYCSVDTVTIDQYGYDGSEGIKIVFRGPRKAIDRIDDGYDVVSDQVDQALKKSTPNNVWISSITWKATTFVADRNWRNDLQELIKGRGISNQASGAQSPRMWQGFRFRSATEIRIAMALDRAGVLFFPLPRARIALTNGHKNVEPDFIVCQEGRWGILEVDGEPFHPPERSAVEHDRDRQFRRHGVVTVERFDASRCYADPDKVVEEFLLMMVKAYRRP